MIAPVDGLTIMVDCQASEVISLIKDFRHAVFMPQYNVVVGRVKASEIGDLNDSKEVNKEDWYVASFDLVTRDWLTFNKSQLQDDAKWSFTKPYCCYVAAGQLGKREGYNEDTYPAVDGVVHYSSELIENGQLKTWKACFTMFDVPAEKEDPLERKHMLKSKARRRRGRTKRGKREPTPTKLQVDYQLQLENESLEEFKDDSELSIMSVGGFKQLLVLGKDKSGDKNILVKYEVAFDWQPAVQNNDATMLVKLTNPSAVELPSRYC